MPITTQNSLELGGDLPKNSQPDTRTIQEDKQNTRRQLMCFFVLAQMTLLGWLLPKDTILAWRLHYMLHPIPVTPVQDYSAALKRDPVVGSFSLLTGEKTLLSTVKPTRLAYLVVPAGDCAGCMAVDLQRWQRDASSHEISMILLTSASQKQADHFMQHLGLSVPIIADPKSTLLAPLNPIWPGRAYLFSPKWRLLWVQRERVPAYIPFKDAGFLQALHGAGQ